MPKKIVLKLINGVSSVVIVVAVIILLSVVLTKSNDVPSVFGYSAFRVLTGSMEPTIQTDSFIIVKRVDASEVKVGDIISFFSRDPSNEGFVNTHRVISVEKDEDKWYFETKGDANPIEDSYMTSSDDLIGKVVLASYTMGVIVRLLSNPLIFFPLILIPLLVVLIYNLTTAIRATKNIVKEEEEEAIRQTVKAIQKVREKEKRRKIEMNSNILKDKYEFRYIHQDEIQQAVEIEQICFPPHEACSEKSMKERVAVAADFFLVAVDKETGKIAGFLNGVATDEEAFRDEFFTDAGLHNPKGKSVMLLGLDVLPEYRGQGLAREIVSQYAENEKQRDRQQLVLTCLDEKVEMYKKMGFQDMGLANSTWGQEEWHEMKIALVEK